MKNLTDGIYVGCVIMQSGAKIYTKAYSSLPSAKGQATKLFNSGYCYGPHHLRKETPIEIKIYKAIEWKEL